uniref:Uncharacterized protein n=1 Tax=viral metagenome TaxID=1070528 RepID=A0A6M3KC17_9ZZZZ
MNKELQAFARSTLKDGLAQCNKGQQLLFKRMYFHKNLEADINDIVDAIPEDKLDWAMQQVQRSLPKVKQGGCIK